MTLSLDTYSVRNLSCYKNEAIVNIIYEHMSSVVVGVSTCTDFLTPEINLPLLITILNEVI